MNLFVLFIVAILALSNAPQTHASVSDEARRFGWDEDAGYVSTREEILAGNRREKKELEEKLLQFRLDLARHDIGLTHLSDPERLRSKIASYEKKIERVSEDWDEFEIQRTLWREDVLAEVARHRRSVHTEL